MTEPRTNPFVGPRALEKGEPFFGRSRETQELADLLIRERIALLYAPSGAGKTSLLRAALIEKLESEGFQVVEPPLRVHLPPPGWAAKIPNFNRFSFSVLSTLEEAGPAKGRMGAKKLAGLRLTDHLADRPAPRRVLLFDQFEEVLTLDPAGLEVKRSFFRELGDALADSSIWALFALREEHLAGLDPYREAIPTRFQHGYRLDRLTRPGAKEAIQNTAAAAGVEFTEAAADRLIQDLATVKVQNGAAESEERAGEHVEPMHLQVVCRNLWKKLKPGVTEVTEQEIGEIGDVDQSLSEYFAEEIAQIASSARVSERKIRLWVARHLIGEDGARQPVRRRKEEGAAWENDVLQEMVDRHLLRQEPRSGEVWIALAHDRLAQAVRADNQAWFASNLNLLQKQAELWDRQGRPGSLLLAGGDLQAAVDWARAHPTETLDLEDAFLDQSIEREAEARAGIEQEKKIAAAQQQALFQQQRAAALKSRGQLIIALGVLALVLAVVAAFLGWSASVNADSANAAGTQVVAEQLEAEQARSAAELSRSTAEAASMEALEQQATAQAAGTQAAADRDLADAASTQSAIERQNALEAQAAAEAERDAAATARAEIEVQALINRSVNLAGQALRVLDDDIARALLLSVEALNLADTSQARSALLSALQRKLERRVAQNGPLVPLPQYGDISAVGYSRDGELLALGTSTGDVLLWEPAGGGAPQPFVRHSSQVLSAAFHPNGEILATGDRSRTILLWDLTTGEAIVQLPANDWVLSLAFSPDGDMLAAGGSGNNRRLFVWDVQDPANPGLVAQFNEPRDDVRSVAWSPDGALLAAGGDQSDRDVWVWDVANGQVLRQMSGHTSPVWRVAWSPDGRRLASGDEKGNIFLWDYALGRRLGTLPQLNPAEVIGLKFSLDGSALVSVQGSGVLGIWDVEERSLLLEAQTTQAIQAAFNQRLDQMALGSTTDNLTLWDLVLDQPLRVPREQLEGAVQSLVYRDEQILLASTNDGEEVAVWIIGEQPRPQQLFVLTGAYESSAVSPAADLLAAGRADGAIRFRNFDTGEALPQIEHFADPIRSMAFGYGGDDFAFGSAASDSILWDLQANESAVGFLGSLILYPENQGAVTAIAFSPDGRLMVAGFENGSLNVWGLAGDSLEGSVPWFAQHTGISSLAISPDGNVVAAGGFDQTLTLWSLETGQQIGAPLSGAESAVTGLVFHPAGLQLLAGEAGGAIAMWDLDPASWVAQACELAGRNLTDTEWNSFFPGEDYRETCPNLP